MDPNHLPSSPLQTHRPSREQAECVVESNKLSLPATSPVAAVTWNDESEAGPSYLQGSTYWPSESSLLTSEPLNRSVSSSSIPPPKRHRSSSLPAPKRAKPNTTNYRTERQVLKAAERNAVHLRRELRRPSQVLVASRQPPINPASLKSLDANEILKNPQLRHDLLFDALAFRPVSTTGLSSCAVADMYWESIANELEDGCRCTRWRVTGSKGKIDESIIATKEKEPGCCCGRWSLDLSEKAWWKMQETKWASRLPELIKTLRDILISLMGSTTPCPNHFAHSFSREALAAHEVNCPTITHALVPELYFALDPDFLTSQVRRGVFDLGIFNMLGEAIKVHCAPVRDGMVDTMVQTALSGDVALGLRHCFDCVEVMKLDIANHQVHALRPYLWKSAVSHEYAAFAARLHNRSITESTTRQWIRSASVRVLRSLPPPTRTLIPRNELIYRSVMDGFVDLVCADWSENDWPPIIQRRLSGIAGIQIAEVATSSKVDVPEVFVMDSRRIKNFHAEVVDLAVLNIALVGFRAHSSFQCALAAKNDIEAILQTSGSLRPTPDSDLAFCLAARISKSPSRVSAIALTLDTFFASNITKTSPLYLATLKRLRLVITQLLTHYTSRDPTLSLDDQGLDSEPDDSVVGALLPKGPAILRASIADPGRDDEIIKSAGMELVASEIRAVVQRMSKIVAFNIRVFADTYNEPGFVVGRYCS